MTEYLVNENADWKKIYALSTSRLIALEKNACVMPAGIGETMMLITWKVTIKATGEVAAKILDTNNYALAFLLELKPQHMQELK